MGRVPRHLFVSTEARESAYADYPLEIKAGQTISQPYIVARMVELLGLQGDERILEIGTGSGYQTAILAELAQEVISIERIEVLADEAEHLLSEMGYENIEIHLGDGTLGWPDRSPYEAIVVSAAAPDIPPPLLEQLAPEGRLVIPVGSRVYQTLLQVRKNEAGFLERFYHDDCYFVELVGRYGW